MNIKRAEQGEGRGSVQL